jgi:hypothetical protein
MVEDAESMDSLSVKMRLDSLGSTTDKHFSKHQRTVHLHNFCKWIDKSPDELTEWRKQDLKSDDPRVRHRLELKSKCFLNVLATDQRALTMPSRVQNSHTLVGRARCQKLIQPRRVDSNVRKKG